MSFSSFNVPNITYAGKVPLYGTGGGTPSNWSTVPAVSNVDIANFNIQNAGEIDAVDVIAGETTTQALTVGSGSITLTNSAGNQILNTVGTDLLFNGEVLVKANDIQNITDWADYPAIANVDLNGKNIISAGSTNTIDLSGNGGNMILTVGTNAVQTEAIKPGAVVDNDNSRGTPNQILSAGSDGAQLVWITAPTASNWSTFDATQSVGMANNGLNNVSTVNLVNGENNANLTAGAGNSLLVNGNAIAGASAWSTFPATETVAMANNSLNNVAGVNLVSGANNAILTAGAGNVLNVNGNPIAGGDPSTWANFSAGNTVNIPNHDLNMTTTTPGVAYNKATLNANVDIGAIANAPLRPDLNCYVGTCNIGSLTSPTVATNIYSVGATTINSAVGLSIAGGGGVSVVGGGAVNIDSVGGVVIAGGGAISINGGGGISIVGSGALAIASGGILVSAGGVAINGGGVAINAGGLTVAAGTTAIGSAGLAGGGLNVYGSDLSLIPLGETTATLRTNLITSQSGAQTLALTNVASINGSAYPPSSSGIDINGLLNKINAYPALPYTNASSSTPSVNQVSTAIVPDGSFPVNVPTVGAVQGGWGFSKAVGSSAYFNWFMYNPRFGSPSAPLPYIKSKIQSVWALIRPTVNLYSAGYLGLNLYSYDNANPPTSGFYNTRWAYSNLTGVVAGASGVNLFAGYTYLIYANDTPRITNNSAIGVPDSQISTLRDPYDIYTDVNHIALSNCVVAFNPWMNGTNYKTWTTTGVYVVSDNVVFSGFGTNYNGLFFIATGVPTVGVAPMVNGVVSANWSLISPQPSTYADQPILSMNINQATASVQAVGYVVLDMGFSYGPSTTSTTVSQHISLLPN